MTKDEELSLRIKERLIIDPRVSALAIQVTANLGIVTLRGSPQTYPRILAAIETAISFENCRGIVNGLRVRPVVRMQDEEIAKLVRAVLQSHPLIRKEAFTVTVCAGDVTLRGTVGSPWEGVLAEDVALGTSGVRSVRNLLLCDPINPVEDSKSCHDIEAALKSTPGLRNAKLMVAIKGPVIVLAGTVCAPWQVELINAVADSFRPCCVRNCVMVENE